MPRWKPASRSLAAAGDRFGTTVSVLVLGMAPGTRLAFGSRLGSPAAVGAPAAGETTVSAAFQPSSAGGEQRVWARARGTEAGRAAGRAGSLATAPEPVRFDRVEDGQPAPFRGIFGGRYDHRGLGEALLRPHRRLSPHRSTGGLLRRLAPPLRGAAGQRARAPARIGCQPPAEWHVPDIVARRHVLRRHVLRRPRHRHPLLRGDEAGIGRLLMRTRPRPGVTEPAGPYRRSRALVRDDLIR